MVRLANRPLVDADGIATVTIASIENKTVEDLKALKKGLPPDECRYECYDVEFVTEGTNGEFCLRERCGAVLNPEPVQVKYRGKEKIYNKLTSLVIGAGLATIDELDAVDTVALTEKLLALAGTQYRARLVKVEGFYRVDMGSLTQCERRLHDPQL